MMVPAPLPDALRQRVVDAHENGECSYRELAERFGVGEASISRWLRLHRSSGSVKPRPMGGNHRAPTIDAAGERFVRAAIEEVPNSNVVELGEARVKVFGAKVYGQRCSVAVCRLGLTSKTGSSVQWLPRELMSWRTVRTGSPASRM
jgi:transposase